MKNKEKYDLNTLKIEWSPQVFEKRLFTIKNKRDESIIFSKEMTPTETGTNVYNAWLEEEYKPNVLDILDDVEKAYLSAVIEPFRKEVEFIEKIKRYSDEKEYIYMMMKKDNDYCELPVFKKGTMYKGMELGKAYTLEELGL
ncbi:hypothetical protein QLX55_03650 [Solobacterium moorei]|uniref:hypothetical protein n=1 Tax=Solobacterium moorei TaxID=102148 RepID=UPI0024ACF0DA|nr:hypothetical protein [Solobacterium moorei]MDI6414427.1 hypothetical protein [Solobacterium moorei]QYC52408.1 hypothetical protein [Solobacterium phage SMO_1P]